MNSLKSKTLLMSLTRKLPVLIGLVILFSFNPKTDNSQLISQCNSASICSSSSIKLTGKQCGSAANNVTTSIDFGCQGKGNPITDLLFSIIRFLSAGVGLVVVASVIVGGIQYITARGDPNATQAAVKRLTSALIALLVFIFAYAILNFVVPGGFFNS